MTGQVDGRIRHHRPFHAYPITSVLSALGGIMPWIVLFVLTLLYGSPVFADGGHNHHAVPTLKNQTTTVVTIKDNTVTLTFGPIDLPSSHDGDLAASMPKDMYMVGYKSAVFTKEGKPLPRNFLHHILMLNNDKPSVSCPGEPLFFSGAGLEMTEAKFPEGYGVKLGKGQHLMSVVAFYHKAPPTKNVMASFTMYMAPRKFAMDGCVKFAYPHGHDDLLLITLENKTKKQTLLRTVPDVALDGTFLEFQPHQVYKDSQGFPVTKEDDYEMVMVHHHPLQKEELQHGMGNYLLYMTPGACPNPKTASAQ